MESDFGWKKLSWEPRLMSLNQGPHTIDAAILDKWVRVKYLDRKDIESLGWELKESNETVWSKQKEENADCIRHTTYCYEKKGIKLLTGGQLLRINSPEGDVLFNGFCLNKSELRFIMKRLGI